MLFLDMFVYLSAETLTSWRPGDEKKAARWSVAANPCSRALQITEEGVELPWLPTLTQLDPISLPEASEVWMPGALRERHGGVRVK